MQDARTWEGVRRELPEIVAPAYTADTDGSAAQILERIDAAVDATAGEEGARVASGGPSGSHAAAARAATRRVILVGYSMGGRMAALYALAHPEKLAALVLESAGLGCPTEQARESMRKRNESWAQRCERDFPAFVSWWEKLPLFASQSELPEQVRSSQREMRLSCDPDRLAAQLRLAGQQTMPLEPDLLEQMARLSLPLHYIVGTEDEKYLARAQGLPRNFVLHWVRAGHNVHSENSAEYVRILQEIAQDAAQREPREERQ